MVHRGLLCHGKIYIYIEITKSIHCGTCNVIRFVIRLCTNKIALKFTLLKQHIKMIVLF